MDHAGFGASGGDGGGWLGGGGLGGGGLGRGGDGGGGDGGGGLGGGDEAMTAAMSEAEAGHAKQNERTSEADASSPRCSVM